MHIIQHLIPPKFIVWLFSCLLVAYLIDIIATRPMYVAIEQFREKGMMDEQVVSRAIVQSGKEAQNWWWVRPREVRLQFDEKVQYDLDFKRLKNAETSGLEATYPILPPAYSSR